MVEVAEDEVSDTWKRSRIWSVPSESRFEFCWVTTEDAMLSLNRCKLSIVNDQLCIAAYSDNKENLRETYPMIFSSRVPLMIKR